MGRKSRLKKERRQGMKTQGTEAWKLDVLTNDGRRLTKVVFEGDPEAVSDAEGGLAVYSDPVWIRFRAAVIEALAKGGDSRQAMPTAIGVVVHETFAPEFERLVRAELADERIPDAETMEAKRRQAAAALAEGYAAVADWAAASARQWRMQG